MNNAYAIDKKPNNFNLQYKVVFAFLGAIYFVFLVNYDLLVL